MAPTFLKDVLFSVKNAKCLLISKTIKRDCRTVPFCLGNKGSNVLFSADLKHCSQLSESCITCPFTSLAAPIAPYFPLRGRPIHQCPFPCKMQIFYITCKSKSLLCCPERPGQAWEVGPCKPHEVQQGQTQDPARGSWQSQAQIQAEG